MNLDEMEKLEKEATKGPWDNLHCFNGWWVGNIQVASDGCMYESDAKFIAASREFVPWAIKRIRELETGGQRELELLRKIEKLISRNAKLEPVVKAAMAFEDTHGTYIPNGWKELDDLCEALADLEKA